MIIDFRVRPPLPGFDKIGVLRGIKGFRQFPWNFDDTESITSVDEFSMPRFFEEMDEAGIGMGVVLPRHPNYRTGGVTNDEVAKGVASYADKLIHFGAIDINVGIREAVLETERCVKELGCRGIVLEPGSLAPFHYSDAPQFYPVYERCAQLGVHVVISLSMLLGPDLSYSDPVAVQRIAHDFPNVQFIIAHAAYPWVSSAISIACVCKNVWLLPDLYMNVKHIPEGKLFAHALNMMHGERILFGSAYPVRGMVQSVKDLEQFNISPKYYEMLTYSNAAKLLGL